METNHNYGNDTEEMGEVERLKFRFRITGKVVMNMRRKISPILLPVRIKLALQTPRLSLFPGQVALYTYVGFSTRNTRNTILNFSRRLCQIGTQQPTK